MSFIDDIVNSVKAELYDRSVSPLMGSFIISWLLWNYKFVLLIFSNIAIDEKFSQIDKLYTNYDTEGIWFWLLLPLITTLIHIYLYPIPAKYVFKHARNKQRELKEIKTQIEDETPLTKEEARDIKRQLALLQIEHEKELERKDSEIEGLKNEVKKHKSSAEDSYIGEAKKSEKQIIKEAHPSKDTAVLSDKEVEILKTIGANSINKYLYINSRPDKNEAEHLINQLHKKGFIDSIGSYITNTKKTMEYLFEYHLN
tara:strand:+ start:382 stop:1149 length:768 start_codon:yes stop_codon:yes gene_type:complete